MPFFRSSKLTGRKATKKPTVTICSYNLGEGFEQRHMLVPVAAARRMPAVRYRALATPNEEIVTTRRSPLEELAAWAAAEAARASESNVDENVARSQPPALARPQGSLISAFASDIDDEEEEDAETLCEQQDYSPEVPVVIKQREPLSPLSVDLDRWFPSEMCSTAGAQKPMYRQAAYARI